MLTDDRNDGPPPPHYGALPGVHPRARKKIYIADRCYLDGEDATMSIPTGRIEQREAFVDSLPDVICVDGGNGLEQMFADWLKESKVH